MGKADHRAVYEGLLRRYVTPLRRLAWSYEHQPAAREDLFQEIAMALWTPLPRFRGDCSERTWVYRVAHNTAITFAGQRRRRDGREQPGAAAHELVSAPLQEGDAIERQQRERLWAAVQELPIAERQRRTDFLMNDRFFVSCPYCGEEVEIYVEPDVKGTFVQDCEVCCQPWRVRVHGRSEERQVEVTRADGSE